MKITDRWPFVLLHKTIKKDRKPINLNSPSNIHHHLTSALLWLTTAGKNSIDGGIPAQFDLLRNRWNPSYPETTGYIIPTLLDYAQQVNDKSLIKSAISYADYLLNSTTSEGGVSHWSDLKKTGVPIPFDTGQVIFGWLSAWKVTNDKKYLDAAVRAGNWLHDVQNSDGSWFNPYLGITRVIDTCVSWALLELTEITSNSIYMLTARKNLDWALSQKQSNHWIRRASFKENRDPFTHTIAYVARGFLESGCLLEENEYIDAARSIGNSVLGLQKPNGAINSTFNSKWNPTSSSVCLTGNCQFALLWLRLSEIDNDNNYLLAAKKALEFVASVQDNQINNEGIKGGIPGSYPIYGKYEPFKYPNWAVKFFIDGLLMLYLVFSLKK